MNEYVRRKLNRLRIVKIILTPLLIALFGALLYRAVVYYWEQDYGTLKAVLSHLEGDAVTFSEPDGVYEGAIDVALTMQEELPEDARIYYTLDGTDPVPEALSPAGDPSNGPEDAPEGQGSTERYFAPVHLSADTAAVTMVTMKACVCWQGECSDVQTRYYLLARDAEAYAALQDMYTVAVTAPEEALYDYETGILADGALHDAALERREADPEAPNPEGIGNWSQEGPEWVRAVHLSVFSPEGSLLLQQPAGLAVSGNISRRRAPVSLVVTSGSVYTQAWAEGIAGAIPSLTEADSSEDRETADAASTADAALEDPRFSLNLFTPGEEDVHSYVTEYRKLRLRSMTQIYRDIQTAFFSRIAAESGLAGVATNRRALVLINEEIHSLADLQPNYTGGWLARRFSLPEGDAVETVKGSDEEILSAMGVRGLFRGDLQTEAGRQALEAAVDMDDLLLYYAVEILSDNRDWPAKNTEAWRYLPGLEGSGSAGYISPADNPYADGRIRFLLFDLDNIYMGARNNVLFQTEILSALMEEEDGIFSTLMKSDYYRRRFETVVCDLLDTTFRTSYLLDTYDEIYREYRQQLQALDLADAEQLEALDQNAEGRRQGIEEREEIFRGLMEDLLLPGEAGKEVQETSVSLRSLLPYRITARQGVTLQWGTRKLTGEGTAEGRYYADCEVTLTARPAPGMLWDGWTVNGRRLAADDPAVSADGLQLDLGRLLRNMAAETETGTGRSVLTVQAHVHQAEAPALVISEVSCKDGRDWVTLYNAGTLPVSLGGYQLFNTSAQAYNDLPNKTLEAGAEIRFCSKQSMLAQVGGGLLSFRIREGDGIYLLRKNSTEPESTETGYEDTLAPAAAAGTDTPVFPHAAVIDHLTVPRMCDGEIYGRQKDASGAVTASYSFTLTEGQ